MFYSFYCQQKKKQIFFNKLKQTNFKTLLKVNEKKNIFLSNAQKNIFIFKKTQQSTYMLANSLIRRFSSLTNFSYTNSLDVLNSIISNLVNHFSFNKLYYIVKLLFIITPVPKHKIVLYFLRALIKSAFQQTSNITGISIMLRGKLAATGNKRRSSFKIQLGKGGASNLNTLSVNDFRLIRTATGVIGVTSNFTYTH